MLGFIVVAPDFVAVILGDKWRSAVPVLQLLAVVALAQGMALIGQRVLAAVDKTKTVFRFAVFNTIAVIGCFCARSAMGSCGCLHLLCRRVGAPPNVLHLAYGARGVDIAPRGRSNAAWCDDRIGGNGGSCLALRSYLVSLHSAPVVCLAAVSVLGMLVYAGTCLVVVPELIAEIRNVRARRHHAEALAVPT